MTDWIVFYAAFNNISILSWQRLTSFMSFLDFTSTRLGLWSVMPKDTPMKSPEDAVRLKPRNPGLRVKHFITEPHMTPCEKLNTQKSRHWIMQAKQIWTILRYIELCRQCKYSVTRWFATNEEKPSAPLVTYATAIAIGWSFFSAC